MNRSLNTDTEGGRLTRDRRHWGSVAATARRRARYLIAQGAEAGDPDVQAELRAARLARSAVAELRAARREGA